MEDDHASDEIYWGQSVSGLFTVNSAYNLSTGIDSVHTDKFWEVIWHLQVPNRVRSFLWIVKHKRIMCNVERLRRGFTTNGGCAFCHSDVEDIDHILRGCPKARKVWVEVLPVGEIQTHQSLCFDNWLQYNLLNSMKIAGFTNWPAGFALIVWWLWKWRNAFVFNNERFSMEYKISFIKTQVMEIACALEKPCLFENRSVSTTIHIRWKHPSTNWIALNVDGCMKSPSGVAGCGGLCRDHNGNWLHGFVYNIGVCSALEAEFWAVIKGLICAWDEGHRKVVLQCDSLSVVNCLKSGVIPRLAVKNLVEAVQNLMRRQWEVDVLHVYIYKIMCFYRLKNY
ncbi:hypothetical protein PTKIN_Ptkin09bG0036900 [Pterospermum kingtungense]